MKAEESAWRVLWYEAVGFALVIALTWVDALLPSTRSLSRAEFAAQQYDERLQITGLILVLAIVVLLLTRNLVERLRRLEGLLHVCAWCGRVDEADKWVSVEEFCERE